MNRPQVSAWLAKYISKRCNIPESDVGEDTPFDEFGIDSLLAVTMTADMEEQFGLHLIPTAIFEFNTIRLLLDAVVSSKEIYE